VASFSAFTQTDPAAGIQPFSTNRFGVDLATSNINVEIPVRDKLGFPYSLVQNSHAYAYEYTVSGQSFASWGINYKMQGQPAMGATWNFSKQQTNTCMGHNDIVLSSFSVIDSTGAAHQTSNLPIDEWGCDGTQSTGTTYDNSGFTLVLTSSGQGGANDGISGVIYDRHGNAMGPISAVYFSGTSFLATATDPDGNTIKYTSSGWTDALNQLVVPYKDAIGNTQQYQVAYQSYSWATAFGCGVFGGRITLADQTGTTQLNLPSQVTIPGGGSYQIQYEQAPGYSGTGKFGPYSTGRISKVIYPNGGSISYGYGGQNNGIDCNTFVVPTLTVTVNDNKGNNSTWTYANSYDNLHIPAFTVTETDPAGDTITHNFGGSGKETERIIQDVKLGVLSDTVTCYNQTYTSKSSCLSFPGALSITQTDVYTSLGTSSPSLVETVFDTAGNVTAVKKWDVGATYPPSGTPVSETDSTYSNVNSVSCGSMPSYMTDRPCTVTTYSSGTMVSQTNYTYNATGHPTQTKTLVAGSTTLNTSATYNTNGTIATSTDANGAVTTYNYNGTGGCNNLLLTSTVSPLDSQGNSLTTSQTWDCNGGVLTSSTDANGQVTNYGYLDQNGKADPFWRRRSVTDPLNNTSQTIYSAGGTLPATAETVLPISSTSAVDELTTFDGLGRPYLQQTKQAPGSTSFDTVVTAYDALGRVSSVGLPCVSTASAPCTSSQTTTTYDALNRPLQVTDGGGGFTSYNYAPAGSFNNDVLVTLGPAPSGENTKRKQLEYDGLGRLTSVCELTASANGGGNCAQNAPQTGYWTKYTYDTTTLNSATVTRYTVSQNAQSSAPQTRTYLYDLLGRLVQESNPESGTASYAYDSDPSATCPAPYTSGDLIKRTDNAGNVTCYAYDKLHRMTATTYSGPNSTGTNRYFVYDAATLNTQSMANPEGRMAEAYTAASVGGTKVTDEGFSYNGRGDLASFYESTPHSGGYYNVPMMFWANGLINTVGPFLTDPQITTTPDGEGRMNTVSKAGSSVMSISYMQNGQPTGNQPTQINTSCAGSTCYPIEYQYDPKTLRMTQYAAALNGGTYSSGAPAWNANGSLQQLVITDPFNSSYSQTCTYSADDLSRIASVNCTSGSTNVWAQNFTYDAFGNITKTVPTNGTGISWIPGYNASTNRYTLGGTSYDADGNVLNDTFNKYTYDAEGKCSRRHIRRRVGPPIRTFTTPSVTRWSGWTMVGTKPRTLPWARSSSRPRDKRRATRSFRRPEEP
jgi:YD repeat-containing protein